MTTTFSRTDTSVVGRWWWTIDRLSLAALCTIMFIGCLLILAASPAVATRIGLDYFYFVKRQLVLVPPALAIMLAVSMLDMVSVRRLALVGFVGTLVLLLLVPVMGAEIKGARRWINIAGFSLQPSEFLKPTFAVVAAWLFARARARGTLLAFVPPIALWGLCAALLLAQPDLGQTVVLSAIWFTQFFLAGLPVILMVIGAVAGAAGLVMAYHTFPHVTSRINRFLDPDSGDTFQVDRSLEAFYKGGLFGQGPGEGRVKQVIPDVHADFIYAVAGEEFGMIACLIILALFSLVVLRGFAKAMRETNLFVMLAVAGLFTQFGLQAAIHMASTLHLMPTKGMTLPFISYGGSSLLAIGIGCGFALALTRKRYGRVDP
ncbi:MAG: putative lipid II flippase FtsW [Alphaproteobacteria bacterium]|nr:putative lipid II flippase FtsW [Alphaproteobacteria bacterium]